MKSCTPSPEVAITERHAAPQATEFLTDVARFTGIGAVSHIVGTIPAHLQIAPVDQEHREVGLQAAIELADAYADFVVPQRVGLPAARRVEALQRIDGVRIAESISRRGEAVRHQIVIATPRQRQLRRKARFERAFGSDVVLEGLVGRRAHHADEVVELLSFGDARRNS